MVRCAVVIVLVHGRRSWRRMRARRAGMGVGPVWGDAESLIFTASLRDGMPSSSISVVREMIEWVIAARGPYTLNRFKIQVIDLLQNRCSVTDGIYRTSSHFRQGRSFTEF